MKEGSQKLDPEPLAAKQALGRLAMDHPAVYGHDQLAAQRPLHLPQKSLDIFGHNVLVVNGKVQPDSPPPSSQAQAHNDRQPIVPIPAVHHRRLPARRPCPTYQRLEHHANLLYASRRSPLHPARERTVLASDNSTPSATAASIRDRDSTSPPSGPRSPQPPSKASISQSSSHGAVPPPRASQPVAQTSAESACVFDQDGACRPRHPLRSCCMPVSIGSLTSCRPQPCGLPAWAYDLVSAVRRPPTLLQFLRRSFGSHTTNISNTIKSL